MIRDPLMMLFPPSAKVTRKPRTNNRRPRPAVYYKPERDYYDDPEIIEAAYTLMLLSGNHDVRMPCTEPVNARDKGKRIAEEYDYDRHCHERDKPSSSRSAKGKRIAQEYDYDHHYHEHNQQSSSRSAEGKRCAEDGDDDADARRKKKMKKFAEDEDHENNKPSSSRNAETKRFLEDDDDDDDAHRTKKIKWVAEDEDHDNDKPSSSRNTERKRFVEDDDEDDGAREYEMVKMFAEDDDYNKPSSSRNAAKVVKKARTSNKRNTRPVINNGPEPPSTLSEEFVGAINAMAQGRAITQEPMLVIEKKISATDLSCIHNRLAIPHNQVANTNFLSERENQRLLEREAKLTKDGRPFKNKSPCSLEVKVILPSLECVTMNLRRWDMNNSFIYALTNKWTDIARKNGISADRVIRVWAFRIDGEENLCFVLGIKNQ